MAAVKLLTFFLGKHAVTREVVHINTIRDKTFETNSSFYMKQRTMVKCSISIFKEFCDSKGKSSFWGEDCALGYNSMKYRDKYKVSLYVRAHIKIITENFSF